MRTCLQLFITIALAASLASCATVTPLPTATMPAALTTTLANQQARLGQLFELRGGEAINFPDEKLWIRFEEVLEDSRCPKNVACFWSGQVRLALQARLGDQEPVWLELGTISPQDSVQFEAYTILLKIVNPYPASPEQNITFEEYIISLVVNQAQ
ncbi:MAG: hypothetical protein AB1894_19350 [Chloroflexota bacterium]